MRILSILPALMLIPATTASARGADVDLSKIDRSIAKEPAYWNRPKYCLLVFGTEAKFRVWLVLDGDVLYVDRNGNGDLTEQDDRVVPEKPDNGSPGLTLTEPDGTRHTYLTVAPQKDGGRAISVKSETKYLQRSGSVTFAGRAKEAPILHFNAPVSILFSSAVPHEQRGWSEPPAAGGRVRLPLGKDYPVPGDRPKERVVGLSAVMGTPGLGEGTFVTYKAHDIQGQNDPRVAVEAAFPNLDARAEPIVAKGFLEPDTCCGSHLVGSVRVPRQAKLGDVTITLSLPDWKEALPKPAAMKVTIPDTK